MSAWIDAVNALGFALVALALRLEVATSTSWRPCPACDAVSRGKGDTRGPIGCGDGRGWRCWRCDLRGGPVDLVSAATFGEILAPGDSRWPELRDRCDTLGLLDAKPPRSVAPGALQYPDVHDVERLLDGCRSVERDAGVSSWLRSRGLDPVAVADRRLAFALSPRPPFVPHWAVKDRCAWQEARPRYRLLVPLVDVGGNVRSVHARAVAPVREDESKSVFPWKHSVTGLVMANRLAHGLLRREPAAVTRVRESDAPLATDFSPFGIVIVEGVPDFLAAATWWKTRPFPAVLGIISGSWRRELAEKIPDGTRVLVATDPDKAGEEYAERITRSLVDRCEVFRWIGTEDVAAIGLVGGIVRRAQTIYATEKRA